MRSVLAIAAHFDDLELGCGGTLARHVALGDHVAALVVTTSGYSDPGGTLIRDGITARDEGTRGLGELGITQVLTCDLPTFGIAFDEVLNAAILGHVRQVAPDVVYTHWGQDVHHDHQVVAASVQHCCRHIPRLLMFRSNWYEGVQAFRGRFWVDITRTWAAKERAIRCHRSEMERTGGVWLTHARGEAECVGRQAGVPLAEAFEVVRWLEAG